MYTLDEELNKKGSEARARILADFDDSLEAVEHLAHGTKVLRQLPVTENGIVCHKCGSPVNEQVYTVPPFWPALRWKLEWGRQIIKEEPVKRVTHDLDPETVRLMRDYIDGPASAPVLLPAPNSNGVINLHDPDDNDNPDHR